MCMSLGYGPPTGTNESGMFGFNSLSHDPESRDGTSNTFMLGEAAGGFPICDGVGCTTHTLRPLRPLLAGRGSQPAGVGGRGVCLFG